MVRAVRGADVSSGNWTFAICGACHGNRARAGRDLLDYPVCGRCDGTGNEPDDEFALPRIPRELRRNLIEPCGRCGGAGYNRPGGAVLMGAAADEGGGFSVGGARCGMAPALPPGQAVCPRCEDTGIPCGVCNNTGFVPAEPVVPDGPHACQTCGGTGARPRDNPNNPVSTDECPTCNGTGVNVEFFGVESMPIAQSFPSVQIRCFACSGGGEVRNESGTGMMSCLDCGGLGRIVARVTIGDNGGPVSSGPEPAARGAVSGAVDLPPGLLESVGSMPRMQAVAGAAAVERIDRKAEFSECGQYRYSLSRQWGFPAPPTPARFILFIMLNPSVADARIDDNTVRKITKMARRWGYDGLLVGNLFAYRSTNPDRLFAVADPIGPDNGDYLLDLADEAAAIVVAWGNTADAVAEGRAAQVVEMLRGAGRDLACLGFNTSDAPKHPLYLRDATEREPFPRGATPRAAAAPAPAPARRRRRSVTAESRGRSDTDGGGNGVSPTTVPIPRPGTRFGPRFDRPSAEDAANAAICDADMMQTTDFPERHLLGVYMQHDGAAEWTYSPTFSTAAMFIRQCGNPAITAADVFAAARADGSAGEVLCTFPEMLSARNRGASTFLNVPLSVADSDLISPAQWWRLCVGRSTREYAELATSEWRSVTGIPARLAEYLHRRQTGAELERNAAEARQAGEAVPPRQTIAGAETVPAAAARAVSARRPRRGVGETLARVEALDAAAGRPAPPGLRVDRPSDWTATATATSANTPPITVESLAAARASMLAAAAERFEARADADERAAGG